MIRNSFRAMKKELVKGPKALASMGALAILLLACSTGQAATSGASPADMAQDDGVIQERVYDALNADPMYFFRHVDVQVQHGVVTLSGFVWSAPSIYRAEKIAAGVPGVAHVIDKMELERDGLAPHA